MDVTSMLNQSSTAVERPWSQVHSRNRTPWDAGGYSLPIITHSDTPLTKSIHCNVSPVEMTDLFWKHKLSESCSSLSSLTSSPSSVLHSRFSSTSTVSSFHPYSQIASEDAHVDLKAESHKPKPGVESPSPISPFGHRSQTNQNPSPMKSLDTLALIAEHHFYEIPRDKSPEQSNSKSFEMIKTRSVAGQKVTADTTQLARPASPSDKILIRRFAPPPPPSDYVVAESFERHPPIEPQMDLGAPEQYLQRLSCYAKGHKRAASAPDFPGLGGDLLERGPNYSTAHGPTAELTPPPSQHPDRSSPADSILFAAPNTPPETSSPNEASLAPCLYMSNCDTNAPRRKAVSHIFGRNKMCTRLIPKEIWVYYCRKHYQRARYRNGKMWAKLQVELVSEQIRRLDDWSNESRRTGTGGIVKDYSLAIRKREQMRLDEAGGSVRKKSRVEDDDIDSGEDDLVEAQDSSSPATAVPKWLRDLSGGSYDASKILEVVDQINEELLKGALPLFPDIEILPNIVVNDREESKPPKGYAKRKPSITAHKRSQSLGAALRHDDPPDTGRRVSQSSAWPSSSYNQGGVSQKRKRFEDADEHIHAQISQKMRVASSSVEIGRHLPIFPDISEHGGPEEEFVNYIPGSPLAAPTPQRHNGQSTIVNLDSSLSNSDGPYYDQAHGMHKRSQPDLENPYPNRRTHAFSNNALRKSTSGSRNYNGPLTRRSLSPVSQARSVTPHRGNSRHARNKSTPMAQHLC